MIQVEATLISGTCNAWRDRLRSLRQELVDNQRKLERAVRVQLNANQLLQVEQLQNRLHIQLINIHDLKQAIKAHLRKSDHEMDAHTGRLTDDTMAQHEGLTSRYTGLRDTLNALRAEFMRFQEQFNVVRLEMW